MPAVRIVGPERIADNNGTYEPGQVIDWPSEALRKLAEDGTINPDTGMPYVEFVQVQAQAPAPPTLRAESKEDKG